MYSLNLYFFFSIYGKSDKKFNSTTRPPPIEQILWKRGVNISDTLFIQQIGLALQFFSAPASPLP